MNTTFSSINHFFDRFPGAKRAYVDARLYHLTHSAYLSSIQTGGLQPNRSLFPAEHGTFLLQMLRRYGSGQPTDADYVKDRILDPSNIYLSTTQPDMNDRLNYGVPERLVFLMRGLNALATKLSLTDDERSFAAQTFNEHHTALTTGEPSIIALEINPLAPSVVNNRLGRMALDQVNDPVVAIDVVRYVDGSYGNNIAIDSGIDPGFITIFGQAPLDADGALRSVYAQPGWAASIN